MSSGTSLPVPRFPQVSVPRFPRFLKFADNYVGSAHNGFMIARRSCGLQPLAGERPGSHSRHRKFLVTAQAELARNLRRRRAVPLDRYLESRCSDTTTAHQRQSAHDADRFTLAVSQISGKRLTYAELTGKVGETKTF